MGAKPEPRASVLKYLPQIRSVNMLRVQVRTANKTKRCVEVRLDNQARRCSRSQGWTTKRGDAVEAKDIQPNGEMKWKPRTYNQTGHAVEVKVGQLNEAMRWKESGPRASITTYHPFRSGHFTTTDGKEEKVLSRSSDYQTKVTSQVLRHRHGGFHLTTPDSGTPVAPIVQ